MMTTEEQIIAVAELCGWRWWSYVDNKGDEFHYLHGPTYTDKTGKRQGGKLIKRPDDWNDFVEDAPAYATDLNAIIEATGKLNHFQQEAFLDAMCHVLHLDSLGIWCLSDSIKAINASASERLEALCRTLWPERWKE